MTHLSTPKAAVWNSHVRSVQRSKTSPATFHGAAFACKKYIKKSEPLAKKVKLSANDAICSCIIWFYYSAARTLAPKVSAHNPMSNLTGSPWPENKLMSAYGRALATKERRAKLCVDAFRAHDYICSTKAVFRDRSQLLKCSMQSVILVPKCPGRVCYIYAAVYICPAGSPRTKILLRFCPICSVSIENSNKERMRSSSALRRNTVCIVRPNFWVPKRPRVQSHSHEQSASASRVH